MMKGFVAVVIIAMDWPLSQPVGRDGWIRSLSHRLR